jgi:hypothetical protein
LPEWAPFTIALIVMLAIGAIELASLLIGFSPSSNIESMLPEVDIPDVDAPDIDGPELGPLSAILSWFSVGRMPILVLLVIFLTAFALSGFLVQGLATSSFGGPLNAWLASIPALVGGAFATRHLGRWLGKIFPRDETDVASQRDMVGSFATIIRGEARQGQPAEAKTHDLRGRTHYILLEPQDPATTYATGDRVFIVGKDKNIYRAVTKVSSEE